MCGRYSIMTADEMVDFFGFLEIQDRRIEPTVPRFNIAPSQLVPAIVEQDGRRLLVTMRWGLRPFWLKDAKRPPPINARAETLLQRPMFREAAQTARCLIPADGFYEWRQLPRGKQPIYIRLKGGGLFAFAGLYAGNPLHEGDPSTFTIITTAANELLSPIHPRMPVILDHDVMAEWIDQAIKDPGAIMPLLAPFLSEQLEYYPVSTLVNDHRNDARELTEPIEEGAVQLPSGF